MRHEDSYREGAGNLFGIPATASQTVRWMLIVAVLAGTATLIAAVVNAYTHSTLKAVKPAEHSSFPVVRLTTGTDPSGEHFGRLSRQPEADKFRRRLGKRFTEPGRQRTTTMGLLTIGSEQFQARIDRVQRDGGEQVDVLLSGAAGTLSWNSTDGAKSGGRDASGLDRSVIERIALDSPDHFVLAQLRGCSYSTIAQMVTVPDAASGTFPGGPWDLIRIVEPQHDTWSKPQDDWRVFYISNQTGLIDRILYQEQGQNIIVELLGWADHGGEMDPASIRWSRAGEVLMELILDGVNRRSN